MPKTPFEELAERRAAIGYVDCGKQVFSTKLNEAVVDLIRRVAKMNGVTIAKFVEDRLLFSLSDEEFRLVFSADDQRLKELGATPEAHIGDRFDLDEIEGALAELERDDHEEME